MNTVARELGLPPSAVREKNFYQKGDVPVTSPLPLIDWTLDRIWAQVKSSAGSQDRVAAVAKFNTENRWVKKGLALQPVKYAVAYDIWVRGFDLEMSVCSDGTVSVSMGGVEIGQGLNTKVQQVVAYELGISVEQVRILPMSTQVCNSNGGTTGRVDNVTALSASSELCALAAIRACTTLNAALVPARKAALVGSSWETVVAQAANMGIGLAARGGDAGAIGTNRVYNSYSAALVEVKLDVLTGELSVERVDIVFDCGKSLNPAIDIGQIEGAFTMGMGYAVKETMYRSPTTGILETNNAWNYKVPFVCDVPKEWNVSLLPDAPNPTGVLSSKCCGEPPLCLSWAVLEAASAAITAARADQAKAPHVPSSLPLGPEARHLACETTASQLTFH